MSWLISVVGLLHPLPLDSATGRLVDLWVYNRHFAKEAWTDPEAPGALAVLLSQSGFSPKAMIHATRSSTPLLLVHLPGGRPEQDQEQGEVEVEGAVWNAAAGGPQGLLGGVLELRREILDESGRDGITGDMRVRSRVGLWCNGKRFTGFDQTSLR